jgi:hypothetical protein
MQSKTPFNFNIFRAKFLFDNDNLYVAVYLEEPHPVATLKDGQYIWKDNSVGVYFDASGSSDLYNQFDINAWGAIWSVIMVDTYKTNRNLIEPYNIGNLQKGIQVQGTLNDPTKTSTSWTLELAFPFHYLTQVQDVGFPKDGSVWRTLINRAQWGYKIINSTWEKDESVAPWYTTTSPLWSENLHQPEYFNFLLFTDKTPTEAKDLSYPRAAYEIQQVLVWIRNQQEEYSQKNGKYAFSYSELGVDSGSFNTKNGADSLQALYVNLLDIQPDPYGFKASILYLDQATQKHYVWSIRDDYKMWRSDYYEGIPLNVISAVGVASIIFNVLFVIVIVVLATVLAIFIRRYRQRYDKL